MLGSYGLNIKISTRNFTFCVFKLDLYIKEALRKGKSFEKYQAYLPGFVM